MKFKKIWLIGLVMLMSLMAMSSIHHVDANDTVGSIKPPTVSTSAGTYSSPTTLLTPGPLGNVSGQYTSALNWQSPTSTEVSAKYAVLKPGQTVNVYSRFYTGNLNSIVYRSALKLDGGLTMSGDSSTLSGTNSQYVKALNSNDSVLTNNSAPSNTVNIGYQLTAPEASSPSGCISNQCVKAVILALPIGVPRSLRY